MQAKLLIGSLACYVVLTIQPITCHGEKQLVFVHYANETSPVGQEAEDYSKAIANLRELGTDTTNRIADNLEREPGLFRTALDSERDILTRRLPRDPIHTAVCFFDNQHARQGEFQYCLAGEESLKSGLLQELPLLNERLTANPLSTPTGLKVALAAVAELFDPKDHRYMLVLKSHGSNKLAMTIQFPRLQEMVDLATLREAINAGDPGEAIDLVGTTKEELFEILEFAGSQESMQFEIVLLETCSGGLTAETAQSLPGNVRRFYNSGSRKLEFNTIPYTDIIEQSTSANDFIRVIDSKLAHSMQRISHRHTTLIAAVCFLPLLLIVLLRCCKKMASTSFAP